jgi:death on curing protein
VTIVRLPRQLVLPIHEEQLAEQGDPIGVRDEELLDGALAWPLKRTAYVALETCLALNGCEFTLSDRDAVIATLPLASGRTSDEVFTTWVRDNPRSPDA